MMVSSAKKQTSGSVDISIAITVCIGAQKPKTGCFRGPCTLKFTTWVTISKLEIIGQFWFENTDKEAVTVTKSVTLMCWTSSRGHLEHIVVWIKMCNGYNKMGKFHIQPTSTFSGSTIDSLISWSEGTANLSGLCIHQIWNTQIFIFRGSWRTMCMRTFHNPLLNSKWSSIRRFVPNWKKSASKRLRTLLDEFKCITSTMVVIWNVL